jgi:two-component system, OmpR family, response regulator
MRRILLIDDDVDICQLTSKALSKHGYEVSAHTDPRVGISIGRQFGPDLILMDIMLPGASGTEIAEALHHDPAFMDVPVVFLTGLVTSNEENAESEGISVAGVKYPTLGKPFELEQLLRVIEANLR